MASFKQAQLHSEREPTIVWLVWFGPKIIHYRMYIRMFVQVCMCTHAYRHACMHAHTHTHTRTHTHAHTYLGIVKS